MQHMTAYYAKTFTRIIDYSNNKVVQLVQVCFPLYFRYLTSLHGTVG